MTTSQIHRVRGLGLLIGAIAFVVHVALRSLITSGVDPTIFARHGLWVPINTLGLLGAVMVLLGLPAMHAGVAAPTGRLALVGTALITVAWVFFGVFLSLYGVLVLPWLAAKAPALVAAGAPLPVGFIAGLSAWLGGALLVAIPFVRGRSQPRWVGYVLLASALWMVVGNLIIAPSGPAAHPAVNFLSNLGPVLLLIALAYLGLRPLATVAERQA